MAAIYCPDSLSIAIFFYFSLHSSRILFVRTLQWSQSFLLVFRHLLTFVHLTSAICVDTCTTTSSNGSSLDGTWNVIGTSCMDSTGGLGLCWIHGCRDERSCQGFCTKPIVGPSQTSNIFFGISTFSCMDLRIVSLHLPLFHSLVFSFEHGPGAIWRPAMWWVRRSACFSFVFLLLSFYQCFFCCLPNLDFENNGRGFWKLGHFHMWQNVTLISNS